MPFKRLLVANRGEIAIRIFRAATELNIRTVAIYAHEDRFALHRYKADEAYKLGGIGDPRGAYLNWQRIIEYAGKWGVDAIHPGYGFLSENPDFAQACKDAGITFMGPSPEILRVFGDKVAAKKAAVSAGIAVIPGPLSPVPDVESACRVAKDIGYPVTLKALSGGGGKGIRQVQDEPQLREAFPRAQSEAMSSFSRAEIYIEKTVHGAKHIEVQIVADNHGNTVHLYERDCSIQRRHQKVVEVAPALGISEKTRANLLSDAVKIARSVNYHGVGTVEFLVAKDGSHYFLEVNPRIQVEHTVSEMVTGVDIVHASILIADNKPLSHPAIRINSQESISCRGVAIQCRITTEDPKNNFSPDTGQITAYRPPQGFGLRLDEGHATTGGYVTPHYDSLLVKVTTWALDLFGASRKMHRALSEFRIRGVKHNIPLLKNIVSDDGFTKGLMDTGYLADNPHLYEFPASRDRASKMLKYIADVTVNNPHGLPLTAYQGVRDILPPGSHFDPRLTPKIRTAKEIFSAGGSKALTEWIKNSKELLLTDTTMRDAHQSLFATRMRSTDILKAADFYRENASALFSVEMWGGATFDTCLRFLKEDPWERLAQVREKIPNSLLQMLLRGDNAVGYTNYPEWVIRDFIKESVRAGLDIFRIFDCLNNPEQMAIAIDGVKNENGIVEACICYTGDLTSPRETKYTLGYYINIAKQLVAMGTDILCIKDMAGLLRPEAAGRLIKGLRDHVDIPIHLHTHDTSGNGVAMLLAASEAGCDIVDGAVSSMAGLTSQPSLNAIVAALENTPRASRLPLEVLDELDHYWEAVRTMYAAFDPGIKSTSTRVYRHEIPGGQYSNLYDQARNVGVSSSEFQALTERYREVNDLFGNIVKVTPSSKVVGDLALLLQKHGLTGPQFLKEKPALDYPDSVVSFFKGHMGIPFGGFPEDVRKMVLGNDAPPPGKPDAEDKASSEEVRARVEEKMGRPASDREVLTYALYPKVFLDFVSHHQKFHKVDSLPTPVFFYGLQQNEEIEVDIEPGKTLVISLNGVSEPNEKAERTVFFKLNGYQREVRVVDAKLGAKVKVNRKADVMNAGHVAAPMPGKVLEVKIKKGEKVEKGQALIVTESMKMEYVITAKSGGLVKDILISPAAQVESGDLLAEIQ